jgi:hypothetical protein
MDDIGELHKLFRENEGYLIDLYKGGKSKRVTYYFDQYLRKRAFEDKDFLSRWSLILPPVPPAYVPLPMVLDVEKYPGPLAEQPDTKSTSQPDQENSLIEMITPSLRATPLPSMGGLYYQPAHGLLPSFGYMPALQGPQAGGGQGAEQGPMPGYPMMVNMNYPMVGLVNGMPQMLPQQHLAPPRMVPSGYYPAMGHPMQGMRKISLMPAYMVHPGYIMPGYMLNSAMNAMPQHPHGNRDLAVDNPPVGSDKSSQRKNSYHIDSKTSVGKDPTKNTIQKSKREERENHRQSSESSGMLGKREEDLEKDRKFKEDQENSKILSLLKKVKTDEVHDSSSLEKNRRHKEGNKKHEKRRSKSREQSRSKSRNKQAPNNSSKTRIELLNKKYNSLFAKKEDLKEDPLEADVEMSPRSPSEDRDS